MLCIKTIWGDIVNVGDPDSDTMRLVGGGAGAMREISKGEKKTSFTSKLKAERGNGASSKQVEARWVAAKEKEDKQKGIAKVKEDPKGLAAKVKEGSN